MKKFTKVYMFGGENGKDDPTDYIVGYKCENGKYIDKVEQLNSSEYVYECDGWAFGTLKEAKAYASRY